MKRTIRSISQNQPRNPNSSFDYEDYKNSYKRDNQFLPHKARINQNNSNNDRRIQFMSHQHHPMRASSQGEFVLGDSKEIDYTQEGIKYDKESNKTQKVLKFEKGKLVKQVEGNQAIKGFDLSTIKEYTDQVKQSRQLPAVNRSYDTFNLNHQQAQLDKYIDKKDNSKMVGVPNQVSSSQKKKYQNIDYLLTTLNKTSKEKELENNSIINAQGQKIKLAKLTNNKGQGDRSFTSGGASLNENTIQYSPSRAVKTEQYDHDSEDNYKTYTLQKTLDDRQSPIKKQQLTAGISGKHDNIRCPAKEESSKLDTKLKQFMNQYDDYYKHVKGECLCTRCVCGGCKCDAKEPKLDKPMKQNKTNYELNYYKKPSHTDKLQFDMSNYNSELIPKDSKFIGSSTQKTDFQPPSQTEQLAKFVPKDNITQGPAVQWVTSYNRNFINFGKVPIMDQQKGQDKTVLDNLKFIDGTTYDRFYNKKENSPESRFEAFLPQGSLEYALKNPKPFIGNTTHNHFYKPYKINGVEQKWDQNDHLLTGIPSHLGQFDTNHNKDYGQKNRICPAKIEKQELIKTRRDVERLNMVNSQKELLLDHTNYGNMIVNSKQ